MDEELPDRQKFCSAVRQSMGYSDRVRPCRYELLRFFRDVCGCNETAARLKIKACAEQTDRCGRRPFENGKDRKPAVSCLTISRVYSPRSGRSGAG
jgi:uncharacterized protein YerC